ncbi:MAG: hypothetical protein AABO58_18885 [Acidobacteriota bacterium]
MLDVIDPHPRSRSIDPRSANNATEVCLIRSKYEAFRFARKLQNYSAAT